MSSCRFIAARHAYIHIVSIYRTRSLRPSIHPTDRQTDRPPGHHESHRAAKISRFPPTRLARLLRRQDGVYRVSVHRSCWLPQNIVRGRWSSGGAALNRKPLLESHKYDNDNIIYIYIYLRIKLLCLTTTIIKCFNKNNNYYLTIVTAACVCITDGENKSNTVTVCGPHIATWVYYVYRGNTYRNIQTAHRTRFSGSYIILL